MCGELEAGRREELKIALQKIVTILVDDSVFILEGMGQLLRRNPAVEIRGTAADGIEGLNLALAVSPDLVLMDFQMPKMDGITAARLIRETLPEVKIILVTAHDIEAVRGQAIGSHIDEVLSKQELPLNLAGTIQKLFPNRLNKAGDKRRYTNNEQ